MLWKNHFLKAGSTQATLKDIADKEGEKKEKDRKPGQECHWAEGFVLES